MVAYVRHRARSINVGMTVGPYRPNANRTIISMGLGGHSLRQGNPSAAFPCVTTVTERMDSIDRRMRSVGLREAHRLVGNFCGLRPLSQTKELV